MLCHRESLLCFHVSYPPLLRTMVILVKDPYHWIHLTIISCLRNAWCWEQNLWWESPQCQHPDRPPVRPRLVLGSLLAEVQWELHSTVGWWVHLCHQPLQGTSVPGRGYHPVSVWAERQTHPEPRDDWDGIITQTQSGASRISHVHSQINLYLQSY